MLRSLSVLCPVRVHTSFRSFLVVCTPAGLLMVLVGAVCCPPGAGGPCGSECAPPSSVLVLQDCRALGLDAAHSRFMGRVLSDAGCPSLLMSAVVQYSLAHR